MRFSDKLLPLLILWTTTNAHFSLPPQKVCWYVDSDASLLSSLVIEELFKYPTPVVINSINFLTCNAYIFTRKNFEDLFSLLKENCFMTISENAIVNTRVILSYASAANKSDYTELIKHLQPSKLNVIIARFNISKNYLGESKILQVEASTVFANEQKKFEPTEMYFKELFESQLWDPKKRNISFKVIFTEYPPFAYIKKNGSIDGIEYRILKEISTGWRMFIDTSFKDEVIEFSLIY